MKKLTVLLICCLTSMVMTAAPVTAEQAKQAAIKFLNHKSSNRRTAKALNLQRRVLNAVSINERPMVYAFNVGENDGFVLVSGSDLTDEVIGYSDHGTFNEEQMPDNMRSWLRSYAKAVRQLEISGKTLNKATTKKATKTYIGPLLTCQWDQDKPYNDMCPLMPDGKHCATGCTNTAFAQVMYYYKWPKKTTKTIPGYDPETMDSKGPAMPALEPTTFNWDKIYPTYKNNEDGTEVARLMLYLGTANMSTYGKVTGASSYEALEKMKEYFDYDRGAQCVWRSQCSYEEWVDMIYAELEANRPVALTGYSKDDGHSFVIDGYSEEDFFHVNWGWGGMSDGFFKVSLFDTKEQETGGTTNSDAFSMLQTAFVGVQPSNGQATVEPNTLTIEKAQVYYSLDKNGPFDQLGMESSSIWYASGYYLIPSVDVINYNTIAGTYELSVRLLKDDDKSVGYDIPWTKTGKLGSSSQYQTSSSDYIYINPDELPGLVTGDYTMYFVSRLKSSKEWQVVNNWANHYFKIHIDNEKHLMTTKVISYYPQLEITKIDFNTTPTANEETEVSFTLLNKGTGIFHGDICLAERDSSARGMACDLEPGKSIELKIYYAPKELGMHQFVIYEHTDTLYFGDINVKEMNYTDNVDLTIKREITNVAGSPNDGFFVMGRKAKINLTVTNNSDKNYRGHIFIETNYWDKDNNDPIRSEFVGKEVTVLAGETKVIQYESNELIGADGYTFDISYVKNKNSVEVKITPNDMYYAYPTYLTYDADGKVTDHLYTETIKIDAKVCAIDLRGLTNIKDIYAENPNTLYFVDENSNYTGNNVVKGDVAENIVLADGYPFHCPYTISAKLISYTRLPERYFDINTKQGWTTLVLPFAATGCTTTMNGKAIPLVWAQENNIENADIYVFTNTYEDGNKEEFSFPGATLEVLHPYILGVPSKLKNGSSLFYYPITFYAYNAVVGCGVTSITGRNYKMVGSFKSEEAKDIYSLNEEGTAFVRGTANVYPFRAIFVPITPDGIDQQLTIVPNFVPEKPIGEDAGIPDGINEINQASKTNDKIYNLNGVRVDKPSKGIYIINGKKVIK